MKDESRSKKVTYTFRGGDNIEVSRKVERENKPRFTFHFDEVDLLAVLMFATVWLVLILMFVGLR